MISKETNATSENLREQSLQVHNYLNMLGIPESKWSGKTLVKTVKELPKATGVKKKSCDIWLREDAEIKTVIHEHLHARSSSLLKNKPRKYRAYEEGACELLAEEICKKNNIPYRATYEKYVNPLRKFRKLHGGYDSDYDFAIAFFNEGLNNREKWLNKLSDTKSNRESFVLKLLIRKMRYVDE